VRVAVRSDSARRSGRRVKSLQAVCGCACERSVTSLPRARRCARRQAGVLRPPTELTQLPAQSSRLRSGPQRPRTTGPIARSFPLTRAGNRIARERLAQQGFGLMYRGRLKEPSTGSSRSEASWPNARITATPSGHRRLRSRCTTPTGESGRDARCTLRPSSAPPALGSLSKERTRPLHQAAKRRRDRLSRARRAS